MVSDIKISMYKCDVCDSKYNSEWCAEKCEKRHEEERIIKELKYYTEFTITDEHLKLLRTMSCDWCDDEFGAPEIDPKRPYGNSDVLRDIGEILGYELPDIEEDEEWDKKTEEHLKKLHREMQLVLQIVLVTQSFQTGRYVRDDCYDYGTWRKA